MYITCTVPRLSVQPPGESPLWALIGVGVGTSALGARAAAWQPVVDSEVGAKAGGVCVGRVGSVCVFWAGAECVSSSMGASCDPPRREDEFESGGTDPETQLGAGLHSPEALGVVWVCVCFFLRSVSIQLELCLEAKLARARDESLMFLPEVISSPKPSWWAKA